ncbi:hypothetical protein mRhiFer1_010287 [Rhinolophus ferrumequinum]|uniref:non-specific serine/threonine protein kinase n=1 Tax=Rhinolophus ferrumequinum TaxID=59479 RepID=A0A7J7X5H5_RHIFE|nr:hypothetical protein mRhiFer1_010287 [Rhinolophus ferrumequinum]
MSFNGHPLSTFCGRPVYTAPELFPGQKYDGPAADIWSLGVLLYRMLTNTVPFKGMNWGQLQKKVLSGEYIVPFYLSFKVENFLKKLLPFNPRREKNLKDIMPAPWVNMGQEEEIKPYVESPSDVIDPWVIQEMLNLGFHWENIEDTSKKTYNNVMATYRILNTEKPEVQCHAVQVKPFHLPELQSRSLSPAQEVQPECSGFQQAEQQPMDHESGEKA